MFVKYDVIFKISLFLSCAMLFLQYVKIIIITIFFCDFFLVVSVSFCINIYLITKRCYHDYKILLHFFFNSGPN